MLALAGAFAGEVRKAADRLKAAGKAVLTTAAAVTAAQGGANSALAAWQAAATAARGAPDMYASILDPPCHAAEAVLVAANSALAAASAAAERAESEGQAAKAVAEKLQAAADDVAEKTRTAADEAWKVIREAEGSSRKRALVAAGSEAIEGLNPEMAKTDAREAVAVRDAATRTARKEAMEVAAARRHESATRHRICDIMVKLTPRFDGVNRTKVLGNLFRDTPCNSIYERVAEDEDLQGFRLVCAGKVIPNSDLTIGETNLVLYAPATVHVCLPIRRAGLSDDKGIEAHGEDDDDGSKDGADQSPRGKGDGGKGGGAADGGAASGGGMGGNGGSSSSGGGARRVFGHINRIVVKSNLGHHFTIKNTSLGITARALYESIAERCEGVRSADALRVIHSGRWLPNDNSELGMTTLGGSHAGKLDELHLTVVVR